MTGGRQRWDASSPRIRREHFGDAIYREGHVPHSEFDYYCVAHGSDYNPKYLTDLDLVCHDGMGEGFCVEECHLCPRQCPIDPCPIPDAA